MFGITLLKNVWLLKMVLKNTKAKTYKRSTYKNIHQNTPWRGLSVLLGAMQLVKNPLITLDVYSSTEVYGKIL